MTDRPPSVPAVATPSAHPAAPEVWTTRALLDWMRSHFESRAIDSPRVVAELILAHVVGCERLRLYMEADRPASPDERSRLRDLVRRASAHEPVQYLVGRTSFYGRELEVGPCTQIPQPCTEDLVELAVAHLRPRRLDPADDPPDDPLDEPSDEAPGEPADRMADHPLATASESIDPAPTVDPADVTPAEEGPRVLDLGTGTGCIAISIVGQVPRASVIAIDVESDAIDLARANMTSHGLADRIDLRHGDLYEPLTDDDGPFDVICSNPPYISDAEWDGGAVQRQVREHVAPRALRGGRDGLDVIRPLVAGAPSRLRQGGLLLVEIGDAQREAALTLIAQTPGLGEADVLRDGDGLWRILRATRT